MYILQVEIDQFLIRYKDKYIDYHISEILLRPSTYGLMKKKMLLKRSN